MSDAAGGRGSGRSDHLEAAQAARFERMVALVRELDAATARGEAAPVKVLAQLDALLLEAATAAPTRQEGGRRVPSSRWTPGGPAARRFLADHIADRPWCLVVSTCRSG